MRPKAYQLIFEPPICLPKSLRKNCADREIKIGKHMHRPTSLTAVMKEIQTGVLNQDTQTSEALSHTSRETKNKITTQTAKVMKYS